MNGPPERSSNSQSVFSPIRSVRLYETIVDQISGLVWDGHLKIGDRFPPERDLQGFWQVSRPVLREAFRVLEMEGFVESRPGGGRYLRAEHIPKLQDIRRSRLENIRVTLLQIWEAREALEVKAARLAAKSASQEQLGQIARPLTLIEKLSPAEYRQGDFNLDIHLAIARASGNPLLEDLIRDLLNRYRKYKVKDLLELNDWTTLQREHQPIYDAIAGRNPEAAATAMEGHFARLRETIGSSSNENEKP
jgi:GntR family transcriptional regulator, transcriptional repressor for pyruvate dehydrogenase complex